MSSVEKKGLQLDCTVKIQKIFNFYAEFEMKTKKRGTSVAEDWFIL